MTLYNLQDKAFENKQTYHETYITEQYVLSRWYQHSEAVCLEILSEQEISALILQYLVTN